MNAPDVATICKCDRLIRFKIDGSTIKTYLMFAINTVPGFNHNKTVDLDY